MRDGVVEADDLAALISKLDVGKAHLVGHSYGAYTALILAIKHPELVRSLTLAEPPVMCWLNDLGDEGKALFADAKEKCWAPAEMAFKRKQPETALRIFVDYLSGNGKYAGLPPDVRDQVFRNRRGFKALAMSEDRYPAVDPDSVRGLKVPTLLLYGANTHRAAQLVGAELKRLIPDAPHRWVQVPGATHALWLQKPDECRNAVLMFLVGK